MQRICLFLIACASVFAQSSTPATPTIVGAGYSAPSSVIQTAPGQVLSLMVYGLDYRLPAPVSASGTPLPYELGGFSVAVQLGGPGAILPAPMLGVQQV